MTYSRNIIGYCSALLSIAALLGGCGTKFKAGEAADANVTEMPKEKLLEYVRMRNPKPADLQASLRLTLDAGQVISTRMDLAMIPNKGIRLIVVPFPLYEAMRIWMLPAGITVVESASRSLIEATWEELSTLSDFPLTYDVFSQLIIGRVFSSPSSWSWKNTFNLKYEGKHPVLSVSEQGARFDFFIGTGGRPEYVEIHTGSPGSFISCAYKDYVVDPSGDCLPTLIEIRRYRDGVPKSEEIKIQISRIRRSVSDKSVLSPSLRRDLQKRRIEDVLHSVEDLL